MECSLSGGSGGMVMVRLVNLAAAFRPLMRHGLRVMLDSLKIVKYMRLG